MKCATLQVNMPFSFEVKRIPLVPIKLTKAKIIEKSSSTIVEKQIKSSLVSCHIIIYISLSYTDVKDNFEPCIGLKVKEVVRQPVRLGKWQ